MPDQTMGNSPGDDSDQQRNQAAGLGPVLREQAAKLAERSKEAGVGTAQAVGKAAERAADELEASSPELANCLRSAAGYTQRLADDLGHRSAGEFLSDAVKWGQKQPVLALAGAAILGFALARVARAGMSTAGADTGDDHDRG